MDTKERAAIEIDDQQEELRNILSESPLYHDMSFLEREDVLRYFAAVVLQ
jgi:hypothetical protein